MGAVRVIETDLYRNCSVSWPAEGRHILASFDESTIIVYQAYCPEIADHVRIAGHVTGIDEDAGRLADRLAHQGAFFSDGDEE